ncbi:MAG: hypothetical protein COB61_005735 [Thiotrichales bacterium]|nr:hypothetical protein [Thiotrichales bacterium]
MQYDFSYYDTKKHKFGNIELDALLSQDITLTNIVSEHPLETGEILNDAIHNQPLEISFSAVISDMPQSSTDELVKSSDLANTLLTSKSISGSKSLKAWIDLSALWKAKQLVSITSPVQSEPFEDMAILKIHVSVESVKGITFTVDLKQVLITENIKKMNLAPEVGKQSERA